VKKALLDSTWQTRLEQVSYSAAFWLGGAKTRQNRPGRNRSNSLLFGNSSRETPQESATPIQPIASISSGWLEHSKGIL
jgi:hypothetical protein